MKKSLTISLVLASLFSSVFANEFNPNAKNSDPYAEEIDPEILEAMRKRKQLQALINEELQAQNIPTPKALSGEYLFAQAHRRI